MQSEIPTHVVFVCSSGCGYVERGRQWDSPPIGRDGQLRCPDCGAQAWDYLRLTKVEADMAFEQGIDMAYRYRHGW